METQRLLWKALSYHTIETLPILAPRRILLPDATNAKRLTFMSKNIDAIYDMFTGVVKAINQQSEGMNQQAQVLLGLWQQQEHTKDAFRLAAKRFQDPADEDEGGEETETDDEEEDEP